MKIQYNFLLLLSLRVKDSNTIVNRRKDSNTIVKTQILSLPRVPPI
jgi:hypothetical protein